MSNWQILCFVIWACGTVSIIVMGMFNVKWTEGDKCHLNNVYCQASIITFAAWIIMWFV